MGRYQIYVGNIGMVYDGDSFPDALKVFDTYKEDSMNGYGVGANEDVVMMEDWGADVCAEYIAKKED